MENKKQYLAEENKKEIERTNEEIKKSDEELEVLEARLKIEKKFSEMEDIDGNIKEDIKYSVQALEDMILMEKDKNSELKKDLQILIARKQVISKFEEEDL